MDDAAIVAAILQDRKCYDAIKDILDWQTFGDANRYICRLAIEFYEKDPDAKKVDREVIRAQFKRLPESSSDLSRVLDSLPVDVSIPNIVDQYISFYRDQIAKEIAGLLGIGAHDKASVLLDKYLAIQTPGDEQEGNIPSLEELFQQGRLYRVKPDRLNEVLGGGIPKGTHIVVFGRVEAGKSAFAIHLAVCFLREGLKVLYISNEEPPRAYVPRFLSHIWKTPIARLKSSQTATRKALERLRGTNFDNLYIKEAVAGFKQVEKLMTKYQPDVVVLDQLRNFSLKAEGRVNELDMAARHARKLAIQHDCIMISVTQAGAQAEGRRRLRMSDIDSSKTGIPGAADVMIGIGMDWEDEQYNRRRLSVCKNKLGGIHDMITTTFIPEQSKFI